MHAQAVALSRRAGAGVRNCRCSGLVVDAMNANHDRQLAATKLIATCVMFALCMLAFGFIADQSYQAGKCAALDNPAIKFTRGSARGLCKIEVRND